MSDLSDLAGRLGAADAVQVLVVSGLSPIESDPWQAWLEARLPAATWVRPQGGDWPDLARWSQRIGEVLAHGDPARPWVALAHGFGALALVRHAHDHDPASTTAAAPARAATLPASAILVAPAAPARFGQDDRSLGRPLPFPSDLVALLGGRHPSSPWLQDDAAEHWAELWGSRVVDAGAGPSFTSRDGRWAEGDAVLASHRVRHPLESEYASALRFVGR